MINSAELETMLWTRRVAHPAQWIEVARYLVNQLSVFLAFEVVLEAQHVLEPQAFSFAIRGSGRMAGALELEWSGLLRMTPYQMRSHVTASLFLFSLRRRLHVVGHHGSTLELLLEQHLGRGRWCTLGWHDDIFGESEGAEP